MIILSVDQKSILRYIVPDPDAWIAHACNKFGDTRAAEMLAEKVVRWTPKASAMRGAGEMTRAERDAADVARDSNAGPPSLSPDKIADVLIRKGLITADDLRG